MIQGKNRKNGRCLALNKATSRRSDATSRRSREGIFQCRDVRGNVATFQRMVIINVATWISNVAALKRRANPTSRRGYPMSRRYREG